MYGHAHEEGSEEESPEEVTQQEVGDASIHVDETTGRRYSYNEETGETKGLAASQRGATNNTTEEVPIVEVPIVEVPIVAAKNRIRLRNMEPSLERELGSVICNRITNTVQWQPQRVLGG